MKTVTLKQGTPAWHAHRRAHRNASDAPAMMGHGQKTRSELLHEAYTGMEREVSDYVQEKIFDPGHEFEALARPLAQEFLGKELYPVVAVRTLEGIKLSASFDGVDMLETIGFEHKRLNSTLREVMHEGVNGQELPLMYRIQMEQQCIVGQINEIMFMASEWRGEELIEERHCGYTSDPELAAAIIAGWKQFEADLAVYVPPKVTVKPTGRTPDNLPALHVILKGEVSASNLTEYKEHVLAVFEGINKELETDQDFADAEQTVKWCANVEDRLEATKQHALSQTATIDQLFRAIDEISAEARRVRLELDKLVKAKKESIRNEKVLTANAKLKAHIAELNASIGKPLMPEIEADFAGAIKGKRTVDSLRDAADGELARAKITANGIADRIKANLATLAEHSDKSALFPDMRALVLKQPDDLAAMITARIATHEANEAARKAREAQAQAEREAELIAQKAREDAAKAEREAAAKPAATLAADPRDALAQILAAGPVLSEKPIADENARNFIDAVWPDPAIVQQPATVNEMHQIGEGIRNWPESEETGEMIKLGEINARLAPIAVTADGLAQLGFTPAGTERAAKLYMESDFPKICDALIKLITMAKHPQLATA